MSSEITEAAATPPVAPVPTSELPPEPDITLPRPGGSWELLSLATPGLLRALHVVNLAGSWQVLLPGTLLLFVVFPRARPRWWLWVALMVAAPLAEGSLKHLVGRQRPENVSLSFPSGHSTAAAAFFGAVMYLAGSLPPRLCRPVRVLAGVMIVLVGVARVMLRAHWPSDVLAGFALGLALAALTALLDARRA